MGRVGWAIVSLLAILCVASVSARVPERVPEKTLHLAAGEKQVAWTLGRTGTVYELTFTADHPVTLLLIASSKNPPDPNAFSRPAHWANGTDVAGVTSVDLPFRVPMGGPWLMGFAPTGMNNETVTVDATLTLLASPSWSLTGGTFAQAVTFQAGYWQATPGLGIEGITLWMLPLAAWSAYALRLAPLRFLAWSGVGVVVSFLASWNADQGVLMIIIAPIVVGVLAGNQALRYTERRLESYQIAFFVAFIGPLVGGDLLHLALRGADPSGILVIGGGGLADALVRAPFWALVRVAIGGRQRKNLLRKAEEGKISGACERCHGLNPMSAADVHSVAVARKPILYCTWCGAPLWVRWRRLLKHARKGRTVPLRQAQGVPFQRPPAAPQGATEASIGAGPFAQPPARPPL